MASFARVFERLVRVAHLHSGMRALSSPSPCFQLSTNLDKELFGYFLSWDATIPDKKVGTASKLSPLPTYNVDNRVFFSLFVGRNEIFSNID